MGLRDLFRRNKGTRRGQRAGRGPQARGRDEPTQQIPTPQYSSPQPPPSYPPPSPNPAPPLGQPIAPPPTGPVPRAEPIAPQMTPPAAAPSSNAEKTQYLKVPSFGGGVAAVLVGLDGQLKDQVYAIRHGENKLGRGDDCDVVLRDPTLKISREHATIIHDEGMFAIAPLKGDENPTFVNDVATEGAELSDNCLIRMGDTTFRFRTIEGL